MVMAAGYLIGLGITALVVLVLWQNQRLKKQILDYRARNPVEADLELATFPQLLGELRRRPARFLLVFPEFKVDEEEESITLAHVAIECSGMPPEVARDVMRTTVAMFEQGDGQFKPPCEE